MTAAPMCQSQSQQQVPGMMLSQQVMEFQYQIGLRARVHQALCSVASKIHLSDIGLVQVWKRTNAVQPAVDVLQQLVYADPELVLMGQRCFASFRLSSCQNLQYGHQGMPGRVLRSGCVQVVQNLRIIPDVLHPRSRLTDAIADEVGEVVYVPVFDTTRPQAGPVAVLEALLSARATDSMLVANFISATGTALSTMQLSLSNPLPQPVGRSKLEGRKPRPVHPDSTSDLQATVAAAGATPASAGKQQQQQPEAGAVVASAGKQQQQQEAVAAVLPCAEMQHVHSSSPRTSAVSVACVKRQGSGISSSSAVTTAFATTSSGGSRGPAATAAMDSGLDSTLSSTLRDTAAMLPLQPSVASMGCNPQQDACRKQQRWHDEASSDSEADTARPSKMRRSLSMSRTKSVPAGLDQVLLEEIAAAAEAAAEALQPANSC